MTEDAYVHALIFTMAQVALVAYQHQWRYVNSVQFAQFSLKNTLTESWYLCMLSQTSVALSVSV